LAHRQIAASLAQKSWKNEKYYCGLMVQADLEHNWGLEKANTAKKKSK
jgi:hypothetical protein